MLYLKPQVPKEDAEYAAVSVLGWWLLWLQAVVGFCLVSLQENANRGTKGCPKRGSVRISGEVGPRFGVSSCFVRVFRRGCPKQGRRR